MVAVKIRNFGGMLPVADERLLPDNLASLTENAWLVSGAVEGFRAPTPIHTLGNPNATKVYRIPKLGLGRENIPDSFWLEFENPFTDVIQSPVVADAFDRYYWASPAEAPKYNTRARIVLGQPPFILGIPAPTVAPSVAISGGVAPTETRAYVYTWVSAYGEEGPPSPPVTATGNASGTWNVTVTAPGPVATNRNIAFARIYRTITGTSGSTTFYFVADIPIATTVYADTTATTVVAAARILASTFYLPPPPDLQGISIMPNGIIAGFRANEVVFCEPYRPHAWPPTYSLAVEGQIVGLGVVGQTLIVCTSGAPYAISGINPATMSISRMAFTEPCVARGSIVSTPAGVVYASPNGLVLANPGGVQVITREMFSKDDWQDPTQVTQLSRLRSSVINGAYYGWGAPIAGCFESTGFDTAAFNQIDFSGSYDGLYIDTGSPRVAYVKMASDLPTDNCFMDSWTGETFIIRDGRVFWVDIAPTRPKQPYRWRSKIFELPNMRNVGALRVYFDDSGTVEDVEGLFTSGVWDDLLPWDDGSFWYDNEVNVFGTLMLYADGRLVLQRDLRRSGELIRGPSGFKATYWQIEILARTQVRSIEMANTAKELGSV